jgi:preprotein translocase subunit SecG
MFIYYAIATLHVIVCVILVLVVLLQSGRGADLAGAFGGGATQTAFGSRGPASFLSKMTTVAAVVFMLTSIGLSMISVKTERKSVLETTGSRQQTTVPARKAPAAQKPAAPVLTPEQIQKRVEEYEKSKQQAAPATNPAQQQKPAPAPAESTPAKK